MKFFAVAALALASRMVSATDAAPDNSMVPSEFQIPDGLELDVSPAFPPGPDHVSTWHAPHPDVEIDDCEDDEDDKWHWVKPKKSPPKPKWPKGPMKWTTSTITATSTKTVISCGPTVPACPGPKTTYTTITIPKTTTVCPVPVETGKPAPAPPKTTHVVPGPGAPATGKPAPPPAQTPAVPKTSPPMVAPTPAKPTSVGTVTRPAPSATTSRAIVTAGAVPNAKAAGGALAAVGLAVAALM